MPKFEEQKQMICNILDVRQNSKILVLSSDNRQTTDTNTTLKMFSIFIYYKHSAFGPRRRV